MAGLYKYRSNNTDQIAPRLLVEIYTSVDIRAPQLQAWTYDTMLTF